MPDQTPSDKIVRKSDLEAAVNADQVARNAKLTTGGIWSLRKEISPIAVWFWGTAGIAMVLALWVFVTSGANEERIVSPAVLPSPAETFASYQLEELWNERHLAENIWASLSRLLKGFGLATLIGVPIGVLCGCFSWISGIFAPLLIFGRNVPVAALISITFLIWGTGETNKVMFLFLACVAFIISDTANSIREVDQRYVDTSYTLGLSRWQIVLKVLVPLAMPNICNSLRILFGLAFGYIMLAEQVKAGGEYGGLGDIINTSQRRGQREPIYIILLVIPILAVTVDRILFWFQKQFFPYQYGGAGLLQKTMRIGLNAYEDLKGMFFAPKSIIDYEATRIFDAHAQAKSQSDVPVLPQQK